MHCTRRYVALITPSEGPVHKQIHTLETWDRFGHSVGKTSLVTKKCEGFVVLVSWEGASECGRKCACVCVASAIDRLVRSPPGQFFSHVHELVFDG
eukprot:4486518-Amphidinium_carterae.1